MSRTTKVVPLTDEPATIALSKVDWEKFVELLEHPPEPTAELKALLTEDGPKGDNRPFTVAGWPISATPRPVIFTRPRVLSSRPYSR
ncbi:type II toxin -antitoxin system TacA 1-like antitoxin [Frigoriglobus tundricola]|uniref:type II toxin -antitoxin system TacA 1-like antitoxin n=1 Tax=Frigoriglobus tundricola TaxID=2774151 RepID=UPI00148ED50A|nr:DUF1778 domain-containing protein [Frigoriglobus tundricola]